MDAHQFNEEYVRRLAEGDSAIEQHFCAYFGEILSIKLRTRLRSPQLIEDVRQDTFLRVLRNLRRNSGSIEHPDRLGRYVNAVCNNVLLELFRQEGRYQQIPEDAAEPVDSGVTPDQAYVTGERKAQVRRILDDMPEKDRELLRLVFLEEKDKDEVCKLFQVDRDYLRVLLHRAKSRFRAVLTKTNSA